jgi:F-type H+-transporting ATPase subunit gamma
MANSIRQIRRRITASQNISKITKAMEMVAASKMKRAQDQATAARPYAHALQESLQKVSNNTDPNLHPLLAHHNQGTDIIILFSTDKGLCGGLNTSLFKALIHWFEKHPDGKVIVIGRKGVQFCRLYGFPIYAQFIDLPERVTPQDVLPISSLIIQEFLGKNFRSVHILYMDFINTLVQRLRNVQLLPLSQSEEYRDETMVVPEVKAEYVFEPDPKQILNELLPYYIENTLYQTLLESRASEQSARMVSMKNASENAKELVHELKLLYNKSRQAAITSELLDITTATLTLS